MTIAAAGDEGGDGVVGAEVVDLPVAGLELRWRGVDSMEIMLAATATAAATAASSASTSSGRSRNRARSRPSAGGMASYWPEGDHAVRDGDGGAAAGAATRYEVSTAAGRAGGARRELGVVRLPAGSALPRACDGGHAHVASSAAPDVAWRRGSSVAITLVRSSVAAAGELRGGGNAEPVGGAVAGGVRRPAPRR